MVATTLGHPVSEHVIDAFVEHALRARWTDFSAATQTATKRELLDHLGAAVAGRAAVGMPAWLRVLTDCGGRPDARVLGGPRLPAPTAALCNGYFGHVLEFDDTHDEAVLHAGSAAIPAALAAASLRGGVSGAEFCVAVQQGIELTCRLGLGTQLNLVEGGWIYTALLGHFGATLSAALLLDRRPEVIKNALGIVYCMASGNHQSTREGAPTKHVQPGFAAANAVTAAMMASRGLDGVHLPFTGEDGLNRVYLHGRFDGERALRDLGRRHEIERLSFKPYPSCRFTHPAISAALELRAKLGAALKDIEKVDVIAGPQAHDVVGRDLPRRRKPATRVDAQFSNYWTVAVALLHGEVTPLQLVTEIPPSGPLQAMIARVHCRSESGADERDIGGCTVTAHGKGFGSISVTHRMAKGHPDFPLDDQELLAKFMANLRYAGVAPEMAREIADAILQIDALEDVTVLGDRLCGLVEGIEPVKH